MAEHFLRIRFHLLENLITGDLYFDEFLVVREVEKDSVEGGGKLRQLAARNCDTEFISDPLSIFLSIENLLD